MLLRADANKAQRIGYICDQQENGVAGILYSVFGSVAFIMSIGGIVSVFAAGQILAGLVLCIVPVFISTPLILAIYSRRAVVYAGRYTYNPDDRPADYRATEVYNKMNEDNQAIALPIVKKIYELWPQKDANGDRLYLDACNQRVKVLKKILEEQVATEKALANAETRVQRSNAQVIDTDVAHALDYVESMRQVRKEFLSKHLEVTDG